MGEAPAAVFVKTVLKRVFWQVPPCDREEGKKGLGEVRQKSSPGRTITLTILNLQKSAPAQSPRVRTVFCVPHEATLEVMGDQKKTTTEWGNEPVYDAVVLGETSLPHRLASW